VNECKPLVSGVEAEKARWLGSVEEEKARFIGGVEEVKSRVLSETAAWAFTLSFPFQLNLSCSCLRLPPNIP